MSRVGGIGVGLLGVLLAGAAPASGSPDFAPNPSVGWVAYGARYLAPSSGPGPVGPARGRRQSANNEVLLGSTGEAGPLLESSCAENLNGLFGAEGALPLPQSQRPDF